jgi:hypothetical protein
MTEIFLFALCSSYKTYFTFVLSYIVCFKIEIMFC